MLAAMSWASSLFHDSICVVCVVQEWTTTALCPVPVLWCCWVECDTCLLMCEVFIPVSLQAVGCLSDLCGWMCVAYCQVWFASSL